MIQRDPVVRIAVGARASYLLLDYEIGHRLACRQRRHARLFQKVFGFCFRRQSRADGIQSATISLLKRVAQEHVVAALACDERAHPFGQRETQPATANLFDHLVALFRVTGKLIDETHKLLTRERSVI